MRKVLWLGPARHPRRWLPLPPKEANMKLAIMSFAFAFGLCLLVPGPHARAQHAGAHIMLDPSELTWNDLPSLPGVKISVIEGPLNQAVPIMFRLKFPPNFKVPPHWHPGIEHITIISGTLHMGIGDAFDASKTRALKPGSISIMQPGTHHYVWTDEETIGQIHSIGPWSVNYVNPADDPAKK
jgi:quercetin dioxygenase-like cupin family protein